MGAWWLALVIVVGPPKLPDLPVPGMRSMPDAGSDPTPIEPPAEPAAPPTVEPSPPTTQQVQPPPSAAPPADPAPPSKPAAPPPGEPSPISVGAAPVDIGARSEAPVEPTPPVPGPALPRASASTAAPLPPAGQADLDAWARDDARAAAVLVPAQAGPTSTPRAPGDRPIATPSPDAARSDVVIRHAEPVRDDVPRFRRSPDPPRRTATVVLAYRNFALRDALGRRQAWHFGVLEITPFRRWFRLALQSEGGVEGGPAAQQGDRADFMLVQKVALGVQYPHWVTPFFEVHGGAGVARVEVFERHALWMVASTGIDVGAQWAVTKWLSLHAAVGWVHPMLRTDNGLVAYDRASFKLGIGF